jgi:hypothetical protein
MASHEKQEVTELLQKKLDNTVEANNILVGWNIDILKEKID